MMRCNDLVAFSDRIGERLAAIRARLDAPRVSGRKRGSSDLSALKARLIARRDPDRVRHTQNLQDTREHEGRVERLEARVREMEGRRAPKRSVIVLLVVEVAAGLAGAVFEAWPFWVLGLLVLLIAITSAWSESRKLRALQADHARTATPYTLGD